MQKKKITKKPLKIGTKKFELKNYKLLRLQIIFMEPFYQQTHYNHTCQIEVNKNALCLL